MNKLVYILFSFLLLISCGEKSGGGEPPTPKPPKVDNPRLSFETPKGFPPLQYNLENNYPTEKGFELGRRLFYAGELSRNGLVPCGFCHDQRFGFTHHEHPVSDGNDLSLGFRNAQPVQNMAFQKEFMWDGASDDLDHQAVLPITNKIEMNETFENIIAKLEKDEKYVKLFAEAFDDKKISDENILKALSQFMVMMISSNSKYDKYKRNEPGGSFNQDELEGLRIFNQKCASCHSGELFTNQEYINNGLPIKKRFNDIGRARITKKDEDNYKFKVPSLRNITETNPYMHDGRFSTIEECIEHYRTGIKTKTQNLDPRLIQPDGTLGINISDQEKELLVVFLRTLTDVRFINDTRFSE